MKKSTFQNRINKHNEAATGRFKIHRHSHDYKLALEALTKGWARCGWNTGSGRHSSSVSHIYGVRAVLLAVGLKDGVDFLLKNDAPRGGKSGDFIEIMNHRKMIKE